MSRESSSSFGPSTDVWERLERSRPEHECLGVTALLSSVATLDPPTYRELLTCTRCRRLLARHFGWDALPLAARMTAQCRRREDFYAMAHPLAERSSRLEISFLVGSEWRGSPQALEAWFDFLNNAGSLEIVRYVLWPEGILRDPVRRAAETDWLKSKIHIREGYSVVELTAEQVPEDARPDMALFHVDGGELVAQYSYCDGGLWGISFSTEANTVEAIRNRFSALDALVPIDGAQRIAL